MQRNDWILAVGVFGAILTVGAIWALVRFADNQTAPGWVQAIGSLLALFVAVAVAHFSSSAQARRERAVARHRAVHALAILAGDLGDLVSRSIILKRTISGYPQYAHITVLKLVVPQHVERAVHDFTLDPLPLLPVVDAYRAIGAYNGYIEIMLQDPQLHQNVTRDRTELEDRRLAVEQRCREALQAAFTVGRAGPSIVP